MRVCGPRWVPVKHRTGAWQFRAQAVSQKTRKKSVSKTSKKAAAASRSATKGRAKAPVKEAKKAAATKSSKNKRSSMPDKTAKTAAKATGSKATASKVAPKAHVRAAAPKAAVAAPKAPIVAPKALAPKAAVAAPKAAAPRVEEPKKVLTQRQGFKTNEFVVYPAHGVGQILAIEEQEIAGAKLELFVINFMKDKMTLRVPTAKVANVGMRKLSDPALVKKALETLKGRARVKRTMWSRRAQEYEAKINSGDIVAIAEVVRDLYRSESQP
jgi:CarD family transcriptional regulator